MVAAYLPDADDRARPWALPLRAERFDGLPPLHSPPAEEPLASAREKAVGTILSRTP